MQIYCVGALLAAPGITSEYVLLELPRHIHFIGIGGIGVSALAQVALARGAHVSGSDINANPDANPAIRRLLAGGADIYPHHNAENLSADAQLVVATAAAQSDNPELRAAQEHGIRVVSRAEFLGELMVAHKGPKIAVAGTHGKTTTTAMLGVLLQHAGLDPTVFVGGEVAELGGNVRIGSETGPFVAEACEAYDSFLYLRPNIAIVTNVEADHLDHYGTFDNVLGSFRRFLQNAEGGTVVACADDPGVQRLMQATPHRWVTYGIENEQADIVAQDLSLGQETTFVLTDADPTWNLTITLHVPGRHNALNALAAATVGMLLSLPGERNGATALAAGLAAFRGTERRQEILGEATIREGRVLVMDDYAHHPTEIRATIGALRGAYPDRRLVAIFQPHLYSRTRDFLNEFAAALSLADALIVTDIYAAREQPIEGVRAADIVHRAAERNPDVPMIYLPDKNDIPTMLATLVRPNDLALFLGAGDIRVQGEAFVQQNRPGKAEV